VNRVIDDGTGHRIYLSGATVHGVERTESFGLNIPQSYYHPTGPAGQIFASLPTSAAPSPEVALVGLGAGSLAAYGFDRQHDTFIEIDPVVIRIARDPNLFRFITDSPNRIDIVEADGRLWLQSVPDRSFDLIVLDAFSSDAVPAHLLTREAVSMYVAKLRPGGRLLFNVTNTYLDVQSVVAGAARALNLTGYWRHDGDLSVAPPGDKEVSEWVVLAPDPRSVADLAADSRWTPISQAPRTVTWTDDFSDILGVIK
jgi:SAM-dependent methyltransferase